MSDPQNPYAAPALQESLSLPPIRFGGTLTRKDLLISIRDSPPQSGWMRLQYPLIVIVIVMAMTTLHTMTAPGPSLAARIWPVLAYPFLPAWLWLVRRVTPSLRKRRTRAEESAKHHPSNHGWMNDECFVICDVDMFFRARWSCFGPALVFPSHLLLPLAADSTHRVVLPFRFFTSPADVKQVLEIVQQQLGTLVNSPPTDAGLAAQVQTAEVQPETFQPATTLAWDANDWPFESTSEGEQPFTIDLTGGQQGWRFSIRAAWSVFLYALWYFLPVWAATLGWLFGGYQSTGDWAFLFDRITSSAIVLGPASVLMLMFLYNAVTSVVLIRRVQNQPFSILVRRQGVHLRHENFESWFRWAALQRVIGDDSMAGWVVRENKHEVQFPRACFASGEDYDRFRSTLERFGPNSPSTNSLR